jgi:hypothetical protein
MRAVVIHETGGPDVLRIEEIPKPEPNADVALNIWTLVGNRARIEGIASQQAPPEAVGRMLELLAAASSIRG